MPPMMPQQMQQPQQSIMSNPQLFAAMLQQQGYGQKPNLATMPQQPPQGAPQGQPPQGAPQGMPPGGGMQPQAGQAPGMRPPMPGGAGPAPMPQGQMPPGGGGGQPPQMQGGQPGQQQIPPQLQQMLMQRMMQQKQGGQQQPMQAGPSKHTPQELAALGRMGDTTVAHLTPGEVEVPPQVQTPKVLAAIDSAFKAKGVDPQKFVAGSPKSSVNPQTGMPEYNFWSSFLPMAMSIGGGLIGGPLGAGAGDALGGMATGQSFGSALEGGALAGLGDWGGGALSGALGSGSGAASDAANTVGANGLGSAATAPTVDSAASQMPQTISGGGIGATSLDAGIPSSTALAAGASGASGAAAAQPQGMMSSMFNNPGANISALAQGNMPANTNYGNLLGAGAGAGLASLLMPSTTTNANSALTTPFTQPYKTASQLPSWQAQVGTANYQGATPSFANYNPATNYPTSYNFYTAANGQPQTTTPAASG